jgi:hypothetical protein
MRPLGIPRRRWECNVTRHSKKQDNENVERIQLPQKNARKV